MLEDKFYGNKEYGKRNWKSEMGDWKVDCSVKPSDRGRPHLEGEIRAETWKRWGKGSWRKSILQKELEQKP